MESDYIEIDELKNHKGFQIVHIYVRSLHHKVGTLENDFLNSRVGVLGITETWLNENTPSSLVNIEGYYLIRNDRNGRRGGGTCLYIRNELEYETPYDRVNNCNIEIQSAVILGRNDEQQHKQIVVILAYRPPNGNNSRACESLKKYINEIRDYDKKEIIIMGDLNWDVLDTDSAGAKIVSEIADEFGLTQQITQPTRITHRCSTLLDIILTNMKNVAFSGCLHYHLSDHCPVYIVKKRIMEDKEFCYLYKRSFRSYDIITCQERLEALDWSILKLLNVNDMWLMVKKAIAYEADLQCPYKWIRIDKNRPLWFTTHMSEVARSRDILFRNYLRGGKKNQSIYEKAVTKRREFNSLVKKSRDSYFREQLEVNKGDQVKFWQTVSNVLGKKMNKKLEKYISMELKICVVTKKVSRS